MISDVTVGQTLDEAVVVVWLKSDQAKAWADRQWNTRDLLGEASTAWQRVGAILPVRAEDLPEVVREAEAAGLFVSHG